LFIFVEFFDVHFLLPVFAILWGGKPVGTEFVPTGLPPPKMVVKTYLSEGIALDQESFRGCHHCDLCLKFNGIYGEPISSRKHRQNFLENFSIFEDFWGLFTH
jgi:hypothetical protein